MLNLLSICTGALSGILQFLCTFHALFWEFLLVCLRGFTAVPPIRCRVLLRRRTAAEQPSQRALLSLR